MVGKQRLRYIIALGRYIKYGRAVALVTLYYTVARLEAQPDDSLFST